MIKVGLFVLITYIYLLYEPLDSKATQMIKGMHELYSCIMNQCPSYLHNVTAADEHASAPSFKSAEETSRDPTSTGKEFQPGSWNP